MSVCEERVELPDLQRAELPGPVPLRELELELQSQGVRAIDSRYRRPCDAGQRRPEEAGNVGQITRTSGSGKPLKLLAYAVVYAPALAM